jgi:hypothetical protein
MTAFWLIDSSLVAFVAPALRVNQYKMASRYHKEMEASFKQFDAMNRPES